MKPRRAKPQTEALAFRIWQAARARDWQVTVAELAAELGETWQRIASILRAKGWAGRLPSGEEGNWRRNRSLPVDVPLYDPVWHETHSLNARRTIHVFRRFSNVE